MHPLNLGDRRQTERCIYCGKANETREHIPSRVFLDTPYPEDLPTVGACYVCNQGHSLDEEYVACLIECAKVGSVNVNSIKREKIKSILSKKPSLKALLKEARTTIDGVSGFNIEIERIERILLKLAQGHILFEQNEPQREHPVAFAFGTLDGLTQPQRQQFEESPPMRLSPEVGSRAMSRGIIFGESSCSQWIEIQPNHYRYLTPWVGAVRIVLSEYVWCEVVWE